MWNRIRHEARALTDDLKARRRGLEASGRRALLVQFCSLGENCELGFVQEHLDAHPLDLFRWSGITLEKLIVALDTRLDGVGEPENTRIWLNENDLEYYAEDTRYGMTTHTRMSSTKYSEGDVRSTFLARNRRLKEKLIDDLDEARRIFVYQTRSPVSEDDLHRLVRSLRRIGARAELLYVRPAGPGERPRAFRRLAPGLMLGLLSKAGLDGGPWSIAYSDWMAILPKALLCCGRKPPRGASASLKELGLPSSF